MLEGEAAVRTAGISSGRRHPSIGICAFLEDPRRSAPDARLLWRAGVDPFVLPVRAEPVARAADALELGRFADWTTCVAGADSTIHIAISDGWRRIRLDVLEGPFACGDPVRLHYQLAGFAGLEPRLVTLRRLLALWQRGSFCRTLFPPDRSIERAVQILRVGDALAAGASYREIAAALYGEGRASAEWRVRSDFLFSRVRRLAVESRRMANGGWRRLLEVRTRRVRKRAA